MKFFDKIIYINELICKGTTGTADELAYKIGKSCSTVFRYFRLMRKFGAPIDYCRYRRSYYYKNNEKYKLNFSLI